MCEGQADSLEQQEWLATSSNRNAGCSGMLSRADDAVPQKTFIHSVPRTAGGGTMKFKVEIQRPILPPNHVPGRRCPSA